MNYAILDENGVCMNAIVAEEEFAAQIGAIVLPNGFGIGDTYDGIAWQKAVSPEKEKPMAEPTEQDRINAALLLEIAKLKAGVKS